MTMTDIIKSDITEIKAQKFEEAKKQIKALSQKVPSNVSLPAVATKGSIIPWHNHNVTGTELNNVISRVQDAFISSNTRVRALYKEFEKVYNAFDQLDKEYIQAILLSVKASELVNQKVQVAQQDISKTIEGLKQAVYALKEFKDSVNKRLTVLSFLYTEGINEDQTFANRIDKKLNDLDQIIDTCEHIGDIDTIWQDVEVQKNDLNLLQKQVIDLLNQVNVTSNEVKLDLQDLQLFKKKIESYQHLDQIDNIWSDSQIINDNLLQLQTQVSGLDVVINDTLVQIKDELSSLQAFRSVIESYHHLKDVDNIWSDCEIQKKDLSELQIQIDNFISLFQETSTQIKSDISSLQAYRLILESYEHLGDIDAIWNNVELHKKDLAQLHQKVDSFIAETQENIKNLHEKIEQNAAINELEHIKHVKWIKTTFIIGCSAVGITLTQLILQLLGIL